MVGYEFTVRTKSVGPLKHIYQWFSPLLIFNADPHPADADSTEENINT